jgi:hypothetical protein
MSRAIETANIIREILPNVPVNPVGFVPNAELEFLNKLWGLGTE